MKKLLQFLCRRPTLEKREEEGLVSIAHFHLFANVITFSLGWHKKADNNNIRLCTQKKEYVVAYNINTLENNRRKVLKSPLSPPLSVVVVVAEMRKRTKLVFTHTMRIK
jgi:hypothetical protein